MNQHPATIDRLEQAIALAATLATEAADDVAAATPLGGSELDYRRSRLADAQTIFRALEEAHTALFA